ncbi:Rieske (2Fe-2S) protein [Halopiger xanaduensis]|uniref:Rieske (2Fe-2S) iron-sulfur domain protein n=1 Tax=Halopiger xanaduensis (strain DSM 18323 / JCM 14033 / SH-6) TaxID=797210 RepID=F8DAT1_HALXS|nr:Rieske 2Fe-2S domain-containing protein [Halopiger xanaduensis]AEH37023.1 Rieske (2Fe-2S) iron-sulfur domain protein [Halopiger xanaduensis SH-6]
MKQLTTVETVHEEGSWLFTVRDQYGELEEALLVPCEDGVEGWINRCTHEAQRFDTGRGAPIRKGQIICPRHGSMFDTCSGYCDNGEAADTTLPTVEVSVRDDGRVILTDGDLSFVGEGGIDENGSEDDGDDGPASTSHIGF